MTSSKRTDFRVMTSNSRLDDFGTKVFNASYRYVGRMTAKFTFMRADQKYDLVGEIMKKACLARESYDPSKSSIETWVRAIAWRTIDDWQEKWQRTEAVTDSYDESSDLDKENAYCTSCSEDWRIFREANHLYERDRADCDLILREDLEEIDDALGRLSESDRELVEMLVDGIGSEEIASRLGISENALYARIFKMRKRLKEKFRTAA